MYLVTSLACSSLVLVSFAPPPLFTYQILDDAFLFRHSSACNCHLTYSHSRARTHTHAWLRSCVRVQFHLTIPLFISFLSVVYLKKQYLNTACISVILSKAVCEITKPTVHSYTDAVLSETVLCIH